MDSFSINVRERKKISLIFDFKVVLKNNFN